MSNSFPLVLTALVLLSSAAPAQADEDAVVDSTTVTNTEEAWHYRSPMPHAETPSLAKQKAMLRGQQRMARLDAMRWYGFSNSRPTTAGIPWTSMYSPAWQTPGGRPFPWYATRRPVVIINGGASAVYR
jgi:hypothetical protein